MAVRKILTISKHEKILRSKSEPVHKVNRDIKVLCRDLRDTMAEHPAIGLAAPQIGVLKRVFAFRLGYTEEEPEEGQPEKEEQPPVIMINPEVVKQDGAERGFDACLSIPGLMGYTDRATAVRVKYLDEQGQKQNREFSGWDARVILHELDHLDGILFTDRLESMADLYVMVEDEEGNHKPVPYLEVVKTAERATTGPGMPSSKPLARTLSTKPSA
ncbi:MAG: peptide deformylase [Aggregatilineales bacterium]